jgi:C1A family cysteine protease
MTAQDYMDTFVDEEKFRQNGITELDEETRDLIWSFFKSFHQKAYSSAEEHDKRRLIVHNNINFIVKHKVKKFRTFELELNHLADLTPEEFKKFKKGYIAPTSSKRRIEDNKDEKGEEALHRRLVELDQHHHKRHWKRNIIKRNHHLKNSDGKRSFSSRFQTLLNTNIKRGNSNPISFDWRSKNVVGSIKDQLQCGSCYAFATSAVMESLYAIKNNAQSVVDLSPQEIVDCGGNGCDGGNFPPAVNYLAHQGDKQATWISYPYVGVQQSCKTHSLTYSKLGNIQYTSIPEGDEKSLAADLVSFGPIFVAIDASSQYFQLYNSGILDTDDCSNQPEDLDHAVVAVGYGYNAALRQSYWIIKNSWGTDWGEKGYVLLPKDAGNKCGVATDAYYAKLT